MPAATDFGLEGLTLPGKGRSISPNMHSILPMSAIRTKKWMGAIWLQLNCYANQPKIVSLISIRLHSATLAIAGWLLDGPIDFKVVLSSCISGGPRIRYNTLSAGRVPCTLPSPERTPGRVFSKQVPVMFFPQLNPSVLLPLPNIRSNCNELEPNNNASTPSLEAAAPTAFLSSLRYSAPKKTILRGSSLMYFC